ncbi:TPA: DUF823 domain-containing adhesin, partial [Vibrio alginolyticus]
ADTATATVLSTGLLSAVDAGSTTLTATKDGVTSNAVDVNVCSDLAGVCIDFLDTGSGKLFTNSPSVAYLDSIADSPTESKTLNDTFDSDYAGPRGYFYIFNWDNANALCSIYNSLNFRERNNWRLATRDELVDLYNEFGNMSDARGWPTNYRYWTMTAGADESKYYMLSLNYSDSGSAAPQSWELYASCVSDPEG